MKLRPAAESATVSESTVAATTRAWIRADRSRSRREPLPTILLGIGPSGGPLEPAARGKPRPSGWIPAMEIDSANEGDLGALLLMMRAYCDFYGASPSDDGLVAMARALIAAPDGMLLVARGGD